MKQTAVEWLIARFHYEGFIGTYCSEEQIKSKREMMIEIIDQAKQMEKDQMLDIYINHNQYNDNFLGFEDYYNETFKTE